MKFAGYFASHWDDESFWLHLQKALQQYDTELAEKCRSVTEEYKSAQDLIQSWNAAITSDALFAFQKGMEANLNHFHHPYLPGFTNMDFCDLYQERTMLSMSKRKEAEQMIAAAHRDEAIRDFFIDLEVVIPKIMHFEGYLAGSHWYPLTVPGYREDKKLTAIYQQQISNYFGL